MKMKRKRKIWEQNKEIDLNSSKQNKCMDYHSPKQGRLGNKIFLFFIFLLKND